MKKNNFNNSKKILLSGGGTGGSVTPLLAVAEELIKEGAGWELVFVGTKNGPEQGMIAAFNRDTERASATAIKFIPLISGKLRRYFSLQNFFDIFRLIAAFFTSLKILSAERPDIVASAGSFVSVPLVFAAAVKKIPILIHQQDVRPGLANKLMAPFARAITVVFEKSLGDYGPKTIWTGNPIRDLEKYKERGGAIKDKYELDKTRPLLLVIGGGTGAVGLNELMFKVGDALAASCQIMHLTGKGKSTICETIRKAANIDDKKSDYQTFEFLDNEEVLSIMAASDLVISRCGLGVLTELSALNKPAILIPMPESHQEDNAAWFKREEAAVVLKQKELTPEKLTATIKRVLNDSVLRGKLAKNIGKIIKRGAAESIAGIIEEMAGK